MRNRFEEYLDGLLGLTLEAHELNFEQMAGRSIVVFFFAIIVARLGARRLLAHSAGFDIMVAVILGSVLSRAINGDAAFLPTLAVSALLVALHHVLATLTYHSHWLSQLIKGRPHVLVRNGRVDSDQMRRNKITATDLEEDLRLHGNVTSAAGVVEARLERNGAVSVVRTIHAESDSRRTPA